MAMSLEGMRMRSTRRGWPWVSLVSSCQSEALGSSATESTWFSYTSSLLSLSTKIINFINLWSDGVNDGVERWEILFTPIEQGMQVRAFRSVGMALDLQNVVSLESPNRFPQVLGFVLPTYQAYVAQAKFSPKRFPAFF